MPGDALDVFIAYSQEDQTLRQELEEQLVLLEREGLVGTWHERRITAGEEWRGWVDGDLLSADLILLIVSAPFLASDYSRDAEIKHALEFHASGHARVIPIIARPCDWRSAPFGELATLPQGVGPVTEWHSRADAWQDVAQGIRDLAYRLRTASLEGTGEYRLVMRSPLRKADRPAEAPPDEPVEAGTPRWAMLGGVAAVLAAVAVVLFFVVWRSGRPVDAAASVRPAEVVPLRAESGQDSPVADRPRPVATTRKRPTVPPPAAEARPEGELDAGEATATPGQVAPPAPAPAGDRPLEEDPAPGTTPEGGSPVAAETEAGGGAAPERPDPGRPEDFERSLGILATPGAEGEGECVAVLVAGDFVLTSPACARASTVVIMGGNALTATRDEIFDLEPWQSPQASGVSLVRLLQGPGGTYGFVSTQLEESFEYESLSAHFVAASAIRSEECVAATRLTEFDGSGHAYVENAAFDRYVRFVEEAADEVISVAGAQWAALLPEVLASTEESLAGFVCGFPHRPPGNLVFSEGGRVVGIGYPCEPFDRLEPEVRDYLPREIRQLDLDCIATLGEIREQLTDVQGEMTPP